MDYKKSIVIVDYGSQYTFLIAKKLRTEMGVWCEIIQPNQDIQKEHIAGLILSGGPQTVVDVKALDYKEIICDESIPVLGICYGMQLIARCLGGTVEHGLQGEFGNTIITWLNGTESIMNASTQTIWMSHQDVITEAGQDSIVLAQSINGQLAAFMNKKANCLAVQFHPEVSHTKNGNRIFEYFLTKMCNVSLHSWTNESRLETAQKTIVDCVANSNGKTILMALSGGVDSMVTAKLLATVAKEIRVEWYAILIDFGILRQNEAKEIIISCQEHGIPLRVVNAQKKCLDYLQSIEDPETKRKRIGALFIQTFVESIESKDASNTILCQGTIYPDVIESAKSLSKADVIKSHHNVGGLPERLGFELLEPLRFFFKDEVRALGKELGLSDNLIYRHPFPGPGLAIRIIGEVTAGKLETLRQADAIYMEALKEANIYNEISQAYAALLNDRAVGVVGDQRRYGHILVLRAVCTNDFMTATTYPFTHEFLEDISTKIINKCDKIARVMYDITTKPPGTIELE